MNKLYTLLDGRELTGDELTKMYRNNLCSNKLPVAGYFCPNCFNEMINIGPNTKCNHCSIKEN